MTRNDMSIMKRFFIPLLQACVVSQVLLVATTSHGQAVSDAHSAVEASKKSRPRTMGTWQVGAMFSPVSSQLDYIGIGRTSVARSGWAFGAFAHSEWLPSIPRVSWLSFQGELLYITKGANVHDIDTGMFLGEFRLRYIEVPILLRPHYSWRKLGIHGLIGPAIGFNVGAHIIDADRAPEKNRAADTWDISAVVGVGMSYQIARFWTMNIGIRYDHSFTGAYSLSEGNVRANRAYLLTFGIGYTRRDSDGDGIRDEHDRCKYQREDVDGFEDSDGCPDPDDDGDGIADSADRCLDRKEDPPDDPLAPVNAIDEDGCPDNDSDGDGVIDVDDACPDGSSVLGVREDGCPIYAYIKELTATEIVLHDPIQFDTNQTTITSLNKKKLDELAGLLNREEYLDKRVLVRGHADPKSKKATYNQELSERRANAVYLYLSDKVEGSRFEKIGCGDKLASSTTASWDDRMVDFMIIGESVNPIEWCKQP